MKIKIIFINGNIFMFSNEINNSIFNIHITTFFFSGAHLAQLAERKTEDLEVAGSTPAVGIIF